MLQRLIFIGATLFLAGWHPQTPVGQVSAQQLVGVYRRASRLLRRNVRGGPRVTRRANDDAGRLWVYGRGGQPCLRCDDHIVFARLGKGLRATYWCPSCQPPAPT